MRRLRIQPGTDRAGRLEGLFGYVVFEDEQGNVQIPELHEAFDRAIARSELARKAAGIRHSRSRQNVPADESVDF